MAPSKFRGEGHWNNVRKLGLGEIADVVVLADYEALAPPVGFQVDLAVDLQNHWPLGKRKFTVRVRDRDESLGPIGPAVHKPATVVADGDIRDNVYVFARLLEGPAQSPSVAGSDEKLL